MYYSNFTTTNNLDNNVVDPIKHNEVADVINQIFTSQAGDYASDVEMENNGQFTNGNAEIFFF